MQFLKNISFMPKLPHQPLISWLFLLATTIGFTPNSSIATSNLDYLSSIKKFDVHTHERVDEPFIREILDKDNWKYINVCVASRGSESTQSQRENARLLLEKYPRYFAWTTTFNVEGMFEPGWVNSVLKGLKSDFDHGAIGVKAWKNIGMESRTEIIFNWMIPYSDRSGN